MVGSNAGKASGEARGVSRLLQLAGSGSSHDFETQVTHMAELYSAEAVAVRAAALWAAQAADSQVAAWLQSLPDRPKPKKLNKVALLLRFAAARAGLGEQEQGEQQEQAAPAPKRRKAAAEVHNSRCSQFSLCTILALRNSHTPCYCPCVNLQAGENDQPLIICS